MERDNSSSSMEVPNSMGYNHPPPPRPRPQVIHESSSSPPVKLPLAPIIDRRATNSSMVSTRRGSSIFSPVQTLDHHHFNSLPQSNQPHHHRQLSPPPPSLPPQSIVQKDSDPDPNSNHQLPPPQPRAPPQQPAGVASSSSSIRYRECLKNHAASMGGHVVDGCGEFMPSGDDITSPEFLRCAACDCHRNFHRKEVDGEPLLKPHHQHRRNNNNPSHFPQIQIQPNSNHNQNQFNNSYSHSFKSTMVNFSGGGAAAESSSEDLNMYSGGGGSGRDALMAPLSSGSRKRFRTKFSQDQKDRMHEFANKLGWRIQKQDDEEVQQF